MLAPWLNRISVFIRNLHFHKILNTTTHKLKFHFPKILYANVVRNRQGNIDFYLPYFP